jgi:hypothetical protein
VSAPLAPHVIEALAHGREDLLTDAERAAVEQLRNDSPDVIERLVTRERELSLAFGRTLARATDEIDVDALVTAAMARAEQSNERASTRALAFGAALGILVAAISGVVALALSDETGLAPLRRVGSFLRAGITLSLATSRAIDSLPGGAAGIALGAVVALAALAWVARRFDFGAAARGAGGTLMIAIAAFSPSSARAYDLEGVLPATATVTVDVDRAPRSAALTAAARSAGLGLAYTLPVDPEVTLHVRDAPLAEVLAALLPADELVEVSGHLLVVRAPRMPPLVVMQPMLAEHSFEPTLIEPNWAVLAPPIPPPPAMPMRPALMPDRRVDLNDVLTFGQDARIGREQEVRDVVTAGGDATVEGHVYGSVVTMGGDAEISGTVVGDVVTMGGDIHVSENGHVHGRLDAMGGDVSTDEASGSSSMVLATRAAGNGGSDGGDFVWALLRYSLLFLLAIVFLAVSPDRFARLSRAIVDRPMRVLTTGGLGLVGAALLFLVLIVSLVGIPVALLMVIGSPLAAMMGLAVVVAVIGTALPIKGLERRPVGRLAAGAIALFVVTRIPIVGGIVIFLALLAGIGALIVTRMGEREPS